MKAKECALTISYYCVFDIVVHAKPAEPIMLGLREPSPLPTNCASQSFAEFSLQNSAKTARKVRGVLPRRALE
jgi:hypothetical protein